MPFTCFLLAFWWRRCFHCRDFLAALRARKSIEVPVEIRGLSIARYARPRDRFGSMDQVFHLEGDYTYEVDGERYRSFVVSRFPHEHTNRDVIATLKNDIQGRDPIFCYVDPQKGDKSFLIIGDVPSPLYFWCSWSRPLSVWPVVLVWGLAFFLRASCA